MQLSKHNDRSLAGDGLRDHSDISLFKVETSDSWNETLGMVGHSSMMLALRQQVRKVAVADACVLISGESGTGKDLVARAIHHCSRRAKGPLIAVNCAAISPSLIQSELFGHERGAFTGAVGAKRGLIEAANGGTLFLDEIGDLPLELQANFLRFLQEHTIHRVGSTRNTEVDVRVVAASHVNLVQAIENGQFREDLYYRLNVLPIAVPSLRDRIVDVADLSNYFLMELNTRKKGDEKIGFTDEAMSAMLSHRWPGNIRELYNRVQRASVMSEQTFITASDLGLQLAGPVHQGLNAARTVAEHDAISRALSRVDNNITRAARTLGVSRMTLYRLMEKHGIASQSETLRMQRN